MCRTTLKTIEKFAGKLELIVNNSDIVWNICHCCRYYLIIYIYIYIYVWIEIKLLCVRDILAH